MKNLGKMTYAEMISAVTYLEVQGKAISQKNFDDLANALLPSKGWSEIVCPVCSIDNWLVK